MLQPVLVGKLCKTVTFVLQFGIMFDDCIRVPEERKYTRPSLLAPRAAEAADSFPSARRKSYLCTQNPPFIRESIRKRKDLWLRHHKLQVKAADPPGDRENTFGSVFR